MTDSSSVSSALATLTAAGWQVMEGYSVRPGMFVPPRFTKRGMFALATFVKPNKGEMSERVAIEPDGQ